MQTHLIIINDNIYGIKKYSWIRILTNHLSGKYDENKIIIYPFHSTSIFSYEFKIVRDNKQIN